MSKYRSSFEMEIDITFSDPKKAMELFIESDWRETFFDFSDLDEVAEQLSYAFHQTPESFDRDIGKPTKFIEGYGVFKRMNNVTWESTSDWNDAGKIIIGYESELGVVHTLSV